MNESLLARFSRGIAATGFGNASSMMLAMVITMILARRLPPEDYGVYVLLTVSAQFLVQLSSFGLDLSLAKFIVSTEDEERKRRIVNSAICLRLATGCLVGLAAYFGRSLLVSLFGTSLLLIAGYVSVLYFAQSFYITLRGALQGLYRFKRIGLADFILGITHFVLVVVLVLILQLGLIGLIYAKLISVSVACAFLYISIPVTKRIEADRSILKEMLRFGLPLQINDIIAVFYSRIDTLIIGMLLGPAEIAYYEMARMIPDALHSIYDSFRVVFFPFVSRFLAVGERIQVARMVNNSTRLLAVLSSFGALVALLFGNDVIRLIYSDKYLPSVSAFGVLLVVLSLSMVSNVLGTTLVAAGETNKPPLINTIHSAVSLVATLLLVLPFGIVGAALSRLIGTAVANPINLLFLRRKLATSLTAYLNCYLIFGACVLLVLVFQPEGFATKAAIVGLFILLCFWRSALTGNDLALLTRGTRLTVAKPWAILSAWRQRP
jgi:PST family polysaccharide transporter